jgi:hypothetical protein
LRLAITGRPPLICAIVAAHPKEIKERNMSEARFDYEAQPDYFPAIKLAEAGPLCRLDDQENGPNPFIIQDQAVGQGRAVETPEPEKAAFTVTAQAHIPPAPVKTRPQTVQDPDEFLRALNEALQEVRKVSGSEELVAQVAEELPQTIVAATSDIVKSQASGFNPPTPVHGGNEVGEKAAPEIPTTFQVQAKRSRGIGLIAILAGLGSLVLAGFLALYFMNYPMSLPIFGQTPVDIQTAPPASVQTASNRPASLEPIQVASIVVRANPTIAVQPIAGVSGAPIALALQIDPVPGIDSSLVISGLPEGAGLSAGIETSRGSWLVDAASLPDLHLFTPLGIAGSYDLRVQLVAADGKVVDSKVLPVSLSPGSTEPPTSMASQQPKDQSRVADAHGPADVANKSNDDAAVTPSVTGQLAQVSGPVAVMPFTPITSIDPNVIVNQADTLLERGDIETARTLYEQAANAGNAEAALKAGMTYDPLYLSAEAAAIGQSNAEPGTSLVWYARAIGLGSRDAEPRRDALNSFIATN